MGKADLKVTVGLLVIGVAIGAILLRVMNSPTNQHQPATGQQGIVRLQAPPATVPGASVVPGSPATQELAGTTPPVPRRNGSRATPSLPPLVEPPADLLTGNVVEVFQQPPALTVGSYRLEDGELVLASSKTVRLTESTEVVELDYTAGVQPQETPLALSAIKERSPVRVMLDLSHSVREELVAKKIVVLKLPKPPPPPSEDS